MTIEAIITKTLDLQRTSETDSVPALWAVAEIQRVLGPLDKEAREAAVLVGWRGNCVQYPHQRTETEVAQATAEALVHGLRNAPPELRDWANGLLALAGYAP